jgi:hypothetical protein
MNIPTNAFMCIVLSPDDCSEMPVSAMEGQVKINPSDVPQQWLNIFQQLRYVDSLTYAFGWSLFLCGIRFRDTLVVIFLN